MASYSEIQHFPMFNFSLMFQLSREQEVFRKSEWSIKSRAAKEPCQMRQEQCLGIEYGGGHVILQ